MNAQAGPEQALAAALRKLREDSGSPTYREMASRAHYSVSSLARAASGSGLPSRDLVLAYVRACGGDEQEWGQRWDATAAGLGRPGGGKPRGRPRLIIAVAAAAVAAAAAAAVVLSSGHRHPVPRPSDTPVVYRDGNDPIVSGCNQDVQTLDRVPVFTAPGKRFGTLLLRHSPSCAMSWGAVWGPDPHLYRVYIIARRPSDGAQAPSSWAKNTPPGSYGNMLSTSRSCVMIEAYVRTPQGRGPLARTRCLR